jgi:putative endonuclease
MNYTYIVECADGTLYTGWTNNLKKRIQAHNSGAGAKYTRSRRPVKLVYFETFSTKEEAMSREWHIKHLTRKEKKKLILLKRQEMNAS